MCVTAAKSNLKLENVYVGSSMQGQLESMGLGNVVPVQMPNHLIRIGEIALNNH